MGEVSVIITCCNLESFLIEAVNSVRGQTVLPDEIIVVHDGCREPTAHAGTTTLFREKNLGVARSRHEGFMLSHGKAILFLDADDSLPPEYLEKMLQVLHRGHDIAYPSCILWCQWGVKPIDNNKLYETPHFSASKLEKQNFVVMTSLMRRQVYEKVGGFDPDLLLYEDWYFWLQARLFGFTFSHAPTFLWYRQRTNSRNRINGDQRKNIYQEILKKYESDKSAFHHTNAHGHSHVPVSTTLRGKSRG